MPGGIVLATDRWVVNHCVGPLGLGTLVAAPRLHVERAVDLDAQHWSELGVVLEKTVAVVTHLVRPEQTYVCMWSHGDSGPKHLHRVVQPVTRTTMERFGGLRSEALQLAMFESGDYPATSEIEDFCDRARQALTAR